MDPISLSRILWHHACDHPSVLRTHMCLSIYSLPPPPFSLWSDTSLVLYYCYCRGYASFFPLHNDLHLSIYHCVVRLSSRHFFPLFICTICIRHALYVYVFSLILSLRLLNYLHIYCNCSLYSMGWLFYCISTSSFRSFRLEFLLILSLLCVTRSIC